MSAADPRPDWDRSNNPGATYGTTVAEIVASFRDAGEDDTTAAFVCSGRAVDCRAKRLHTKARLFWHAAYTLSPGQMQRSFLYADMVAAYGLPS